MQHHKELFHNLCLQLMIFISDYPSDYYLS